MATIPELIYCANGNKRFAEIAIAHGFTYGAQLPGTVYYAPEFVDCKFKNYRHVAYVSSLKKHKPRMASVLDWMAGHELKTLMLRAEDVSLCVTESVLIIPKIPGTIDRIPKEVNGKRVILGYSVPTGYAGTEVDLSEFGYRPVHLLGGTPQKQMELSKYLNVVSVDGNYHGMKARRFCEHWEWPGRWIPDGGKTPDGAHYAAFERSCANIMQAWRTIC